MGTNTDAAALIRDLNRALPLVARDAMSAGIAAGALPGPEGLAIAGRLSAVAVDELGDVERIAGRIAALGGSPTIALGESTKPPKTWRATVTWLAKGQQESLDALVRAIPADADDAEGEATEHLLEHVIARKRDVVELLDRALR